MLNISSRNSLWTLQPKPSPVHHLLGQNGSCYGPSPCRRPFPAGSLLQPKPRACVSDRILSVLGLGGALGPCPMSPAPSPRPAQRCFTNTLDTVRVHPPFSLPGPVGMWPSWGSPSWGSTFVSHTPPSAAHVQGSHSAPHPPASPAVCVQPVHPGLARPRPAPVGAPLTWGRDGNVSQHGSGRPRGAGGGKSGSGEPADRAGGPAAFPFALRPRKPLTPSGLARRQLPNPGLPLGGPLPGPTGRPGSTRTPTSRPDGPAEGAG